MDILYSLTTKDRCSYQMIPIPPGLFQYYVSKNDILELTIDKNANLNYKDGFELEEHTNENLLRLTPNTATGNKLKKVWKILLLIKKIDGKDKEEICLKAALLNTQTNEISLVTSINKPVQAQYKSRLVNSYDDDFKVCHCKMIAPLLFWDELKNKIITL